MALSLEKETSLVVGKTLSDKQRAFVHYASEGIDLAESIRLAGYNGENAKELGYQMSRAPAIAAAIHLEMARKLAFGTPLALKGLRELLTDSDKRIKLAAIKTWLDRAGWIAPKAVAAAASAEKPLNEMSTTELRALADKLESELAGRAKSISSAAPAPKAAQVIDDII